MTRLYQEVCAERDELLEEYNKLREKSEIFSQRGIDLLDRCSDLEYEAMSLLDWKSGGWFYATCEDTYLYCPFIELQSKDIVPTPRYVIRHSREIVTMSIHSWEHESEFSHFLFRDDQGSLCLTKRLTAKDQVMLIREYRYLVFSGLNDALTLQPTNQLFMLVNGGLTQNVLSHAENMITNSRVSLGKNRMQEDVFFMVDGKYRFVEGLVVKPYDLL